MEDTASNNQSKNHRLCTRGCGFYGSSVANNLCSKCYKDYQNEESATATADSSANSDFDLALINLKRLKIGPIIETAAAEESGNDHASNLKKRCWCCKKKVGVLGFGCRCGGTFCGVHRYPEKHDCEFDYKSVGRIAIFEQNPLVKADKMENRI